MSGPGRIKFLFLSQQGIEPIAAKEGGAKYAWVGWISDSPIGFEALAENIGEVSIHTPPSPSLVVWTIPQR